MNISAEKVYSLYRDITETLIGKGLTVTTMESCTAGLIASLITDTDGSSAVIKGAFVPDSNEAKVRQGVPAEVIERYGVYSEQTAAAMAEACRRAYSADFGLGITGTLGRLRPCEPRQRKRRGLLCSGFARGYGELRCRPSSPARPPKLQTHGGYCGG